MAVFTTKGISPTQLLTKTKEEIGTIVNRNLAQLEREVVRASPAGISGKLRQDWFLVPWDGNSAALATTNSYYLSVELGRRPGKGISAKGQQAVARWAKLKLGLAPQDAKGFAYVLSQKYKQSGRKPQPILDLKPNLEANPGGRLDRFFQNLDRDLKNG